MFWRPGGRRRDQGVLDGVSTGVHRPSGVSGGASTTPCHLLVARSAARPVAQQFSCSLILRIVPIPKIIVPSLIIGGLGVKPRPVEPPLLTLEKTNSTDLCSWSVIMWSGYTLALCNNPRGLAPQGTGRLRIVSSVREGFLFGRGGCFSGFSLRLNRV